MRACRIIARARCSRVFTASSPSASASLSRATRGSGGYVASAWLLGIASNLVTTGRFFDIAVRDVAMSVAAFTLARLTEAGVGVESPQFARPYAPGKPLRAPSSAVQND